MLNANRSLSFKSVWQYLMDNKHHSNRCSCLIHNIHYLLSVEDTWGVLLGVGNLECLLSELPALCEPNTQSKLVAFHNNGTVESLASSDVPGSPAMALKTQASSAAVPMTWVDLLDEIWPRTVYLKTWERERISCNNIIKQLTLQGRILPECV